MTIFDKLPNFQKYFLLVRSQVVINGFILYIFKVCYLPTYYPNPQ